MSTFEAESNAQPAVPRQPLLTVALAVASAALWLAAIGLVIWDAIKNIPDPVVSLFLLLATLATAVTTTIHVDWRRQVREAAACERAEAQRTELDARQEVRHQAIMAKMEQVAGEALSQAQRDAMANVLNLNQRITAGPAANGEQHRLGRRDRTDL